jgi:hypothetical protein
MSINRNHVSFTRKNRIAITTGDIKRNAITANVVAVENAFRLSSDKDIHSTFRNIKNIAIGAVTDVTVEYIPTSANPPEIERNSSTYAISESAENFIVMS